ncbi:hypothetical protein N9N26_04480 [Candidatus Poseidoniales archaeon]|jgi:hypothetical protein|nr:hypothetical protein [Candidatus Poseidoniales archaeon]MDB2623480.1 hypothetical protein [Candidatus Poseidoniales archaeon]
MSFVPANDVVLTVFSGKYAANETISAWFFALSIRNNGLLSLKKLQPVKFYSVEIRAVFCKKRRMISAMVSAIWGTEWVLLIA